MSDSECAQCKDKKKGDEHTVAPHTEKPYAAIFGIAGESVESAYVVRPDLGYFLRPQGGKDKPIVEKLSPALCNCQHYFGHRDGDRTKYFVIDGNKCRATYSLSEFKEVEKFDLPSEYCDGEHYIAYRCGENEKFTIIFKEEERDGGKKVKVCMDVSSLSEASLCGKPYDLHEDYKDGLYYWASSTNDGNGNYTPRFYVAKKATKWVSYMTTESLKAEAKEKKVMRTIPVGIMNFLPGGMSLVMGKCSQVWHPLIWVEKEQGVETDRDGTIKWTQRIKKRVGYNSSLSKSIEKHWTVTAGSELNLKVPIKELFMVQLSLSGTYGGSAAKISRDEWVDEYEDEETVDIEVPPGAQLFLWECHYNIGDETLLQPPRHRWRKTSKLHPPPQLKQICGQTSQEEGAK